VNRSNSNRQWALRQGGGLAGKLAVKFDFFWELFKGAFETEAALRRPFLWLPVAAGAGVVLYLCAGREPSLWRIAPATPHSGVPHYSGVMVIWPVILGLKRQ
jgi:hypothetical protein